MDWEKLIDENGCAVIPDGVTEIEDLAFFECGDLTGVMIPRSVTNIGISAFAGCTALASIDVSPDNPEYKSEGNCCLSRDGEVLVFGCKNSVIPDGVRRIAVDAFSGCTGLTHVRIPGTVRKIEFMAFVSCRGLTSIEIPEGVEEIRSSTFIDCSALTSVKLPESVVKIGDAAFEGCSSLSEIRIPKGVVDIGDVPFNNCTSLSSIEVSPDNQNFKSEGNCCLSKDGKTLVFGCQTSVIPDGVKIIGEGAFFKCTGLSHIEIPDGVKVICENAFEGCTGLTDVRVPDSVIEVGPTSFRGCGLVNISGPFDETFRRFVLKQQHSFN